MLALLLLIVALLLRRGARSPNNSTLSLLLLFRLLMTLEPPLLQGPSRGVTLACSTVGRGRRHGALNGLASGITDAEAGLAAEQTGEGTDDAAETDPNFVAEGDTLGGSDNRSGDGDCIGNVCGGVAEGHCGLGLAELGDVSFALSSSGLTNGWCFPGVAAGGGDLVGEHGLLLMLTLLLLFALPRTLADVLGAAVGDAAELKKRFSDWRFGEDDVARAGDWPDGPGAVPKRAVTPKV